MRMQLGLLLLLASGCQISCFSGSLLDPTESQRKKALEIVQNSSSGLGVSNKQFAEGKAQIFGGSNLNYQWSAVQNDRLTRNEWLVGYEDKVGGTYWLVDITTNKVAYVNSDLFLMHKLGMLEQVDTSHLGITYTKRGIGVCKSWDKKGLCCIAEGIATNIGDPIVSINAELRIAAMIGDNLIEGTSNLNSDKKSFGFITSGEPWKSGAGKKFHYESSVIPDIYRSASGEAICNLKISIETIKHAAVSMSLFADKYEWPPVTLH